MVVIRETAEDAYFELAKICRKQEGKSDMIRAFREGDGSYWLELMQYENETHYESGEPYIKEYHEGLTTMPSIIAKALSILLHADIGKEIDGVGRRVAEDAFWLYVDYP